MKESFIYSFPPQEREFAKVSQPVRTAVFSSMMWPCAAAYTVVLPPAYNTYFLKAAVCFSWAFVIASAFNLFYLDLPADVL